MSTEKYSVKTAAQKGALSAVPATAGAALPGAVIVILNEFFGFEISATAATAIITIGTLGASSVGRVLENFIRWKARMKKIENEILNGKLEKQ